MLDKVFAGIAVGFSKQMGGTGPYFDAQVVWPGTPIRDDAGRITTPAVPIKKPCQAQVTSPTTEMRSDADFEQTDMRIIVLSATLDGALDLSAEIVVLSGPHAGRWKPQGKTLDTIAIGWSCRGRKVS